MFINSNYTVDQDAHHGATFDSIWYDDNFIGKISCILLFEYFIYSGTVHVGIKLIKCLTNMRFYIINLWRTADVPNTIKAYTLCPHVNYDRIICSCLVSKLLAPKLYLGNATKFSLMKTFAFICWFNFILFITSEAYRGSAIGLCLRLMDIEAYFLVWGI